MRQSYGACLILYKKSQELALVFTPPLLRSAWGKEQVFTTSIWLYCHAVPHIFLSSLMTSDFMADPSHKLLFFYDASSRSFIVSTLIFRIRLNSSGNMEKSEHILLVLAVAMFTSCLCCK